MNKCALIYCLLPLFGAACAVSPAAQDNTPAAFDADAIYAEAKSAYDQGDCAIAAPLFETLYNDATAHKKADDARYFRGRCAYKTEQFNEAVTLFYALLETFPDTIYGHSALYYIGRSHYQLGSQTPSQFEAAIAAFNRLLAEYPDSSRRPSAHYYVGKSHYQLKAYDSAITAFQTLLQQYPEAADNSSAQFYVGKSYYHIGAIDAQHYATAFTELEKVRTAYPGTQDAVGAAFYIGKTHYQMGKVENIHYEQALTAFQRVLSAHPETLFYAALAQHWLGRTYYHLESPGPFTNADAAFAKVVSEYQGHFIVPAAIYYRGKLAYEMGDLTTAAAYLNEVYSTYPDSFIIPATLYYLVRIAVDQQHCSEAAVYVNELREAHYADSAFPSLADSYYAGHCP